MVALSKAKRRMKSTTGDAVDRGPVARPPTWSRPPSARPASGWDRRHRRGQCARVRARRRQGPAGPRA